MARIPCENCIVLGACQNVNLNILVEKCSLISEYLKVTRVNHEEPRIFSTLKPRIHRFRIKKLERFISHSFEVD